MLCRILELFLGGAVLLILALIFYLLPTVIALQREAQHTGIITFVNILFGWTVLGWIAAVILAIVE